MFKEARIKLTVYYLAIITIILLFFSAIIYRGATFELSRIENRQRIARVNPAFLIDPDIIKETRGRILFSLLTMNVAILTISGISGYFLAGKTLDPIKRMVEDQKEFVSNASHELRTPLAVLKSEIEVALREKRLTSNQIKILLQSNLEDVNSMVNLSNYLLKLNKFQSNNELDFKNINLAILIKRVVGKRDVKLDLDKTFVKGNEDSVSELVSILLDNAIKYGKGKEIVVSLKKKVLKITDQGIGISDEDLPHIFERFYRGDKARSKDGYGLGLSIAKQIADTHDAKIKVESKLGNGSIFKVIFS